MWRCCVVDGMLAEAKSLQLKNKQLGGFGLELFGGFGNDQFSDFGKLLVCSTILFED